jgi:hypothetical protein
VFDELVNKRAWLAWKADAVDGKVPYTERRSRLQPDRPRKASDKNSADWLTLAQARSLAARCHLDGVSLVLAYSDGSNWVLGGADLDTCRSADGTLTPWAAEAVGHLKSYTEISPSGTGLKIFFKVPASSVAKRATNKWVESSWTGRHAPGIQLNLAQGQFTITGNRHDGAPDELRLVSDDDLKWLRQLAQRTFPKATTDQGDGHNQEADTMRALLPWVPPECDRDRWCQVGMALKERFGEDGWSLWNDWSRGSASKYPGVEAAQKQWARLGPSQRDRPVTVWSVCLWAFNGHFAVVNEAGKTWVFTWAFDATMQRPALQRISFDNLRKQYDNRALAGGGDKPAPVPLASWWLQHAARRQYLGGVTFDPTGRAPADCWNLWQGFGVVAAPGDWSLLRNHLIEIVCGGNVELAEYLLSLLARVVQFPHLQGEVAVVLRGDKGTGKGILLRAVVRLLGRHGAQVFHPEHLVGRFNEHLRDLVALYADEAFYAGDKKHEGILKGLITEPSFQIEVKYGPVVLVRNMLHLFLSSNSDWVVPATRDERRFFVLDVLNTRQRDFPYFAAIEQQLANGGLAAMLYDLLQRDISGFEPRQVPQTEALREQQRLGMNSLERWWKAALDREFVWNSRFGADCFTIWYEFYATELLHNSYVQWCNDNRPFDRKSLEQLGTFMTSIYGRSKRPRGRYPIRELGAMVRRDDTEDKVSYDGEGRMTDAGDHKDLDHTTAQWKERPQGYRVGGINEARWRFSQVYSFVAWEGEGSSVPFDTRPDHNQEENF